MIHQHRASNARIRYHGHAVCTPETAMKMSDHEAFLDIEASLRLEGFDLSGDEFYQANKAKILAGEMTPEEAKAETLAHFQRLAAQPSVSAA